MKRESYYYLLLFSLLWITACDSLDYQTQSLTEAEQRELSNALLGLNAGENLELSLFAGEPMLFNPTNMDIDDRGRVWVIEAQNYRNFFNPGNPIREAGDRILILEDTNQDGRADKQIVFYQGRDIDAALGIAVIDDKVIVSCSPNVWVFTDANGDDIPEKKEAMFTGIQGIQDDHGIHAFVFGPDGRLYFNHGNAGKSIKGPNGEDLYDHTSGQILDVAKSNFQQGMVYRTALDGSQVEVLGYNFRNNYELTLDSYGNIWQSDNDDDGHKGVRINYVMEYGNYGYKDEMTGAAWHAYRTNMGYLPNDVHWHQNDPGVVPNLLPTGAGSPTGIAFYEGSLLPKKVQNAPIHADAGPRVIRAFPTETVGAGFTAEMIYLLASSNDKWFRPSDVCVAPDGSIFVADWYDPGVGGNHMGDLKQGRIYRLAPKNTPYQFPKPDYNSPEAAVKALTSPNLATRAKAWLSLFEMGQVAEDALAERWKEGPAYQKARVLWLLARIPEVGSDYVLEALADQDPNIRITALRVVRQMDIDLLDILEKMATDDAPQVRREVAIALRFQEGTQADQIWARLAERLPQGDRWYLEALGIGADNFPEARFAAWQKLTNNNWDTPTGHDLIWRMRAKATIPLLGQLIASSPDLNTSKRYFRAFDFQEVSQKNEVLMSLLNSTSAQDPEMQYLIVYHMDGEAVKQNAKSLQVLNNVLDSLTGSERYFDLVEKLQLEDQADNLLQIALSQADNPNGVKAARLLGKMDELKLIKDKLHQAEGEAILPLFKTLAHINSPEALDILEKYAANDQHPIALRKSAARNLASGWNGETRMIEIIQSERLPYEIAEVGATQLLGVWRAQYRTIASKYLKLDDLENKLSPIHELVMISGDIANGKLTYQTYCANCHTAEGKGIDFGPSLDEIGNKLSKDALYAAILKPSAGISFGYEAFLVTLKDGSVFQGYISSRTDEAIELTMMGGVKQSIPKENISSLEKQELSLMTEGLHRLMSEAELVDLVSYLADLKGKAQLSSN